MAHRPWLLATLLTLLLAMSGSCAGARARPSAPAPVQPPLSTLRAPSPAPPEAATPPAPRSLFARIGGMEALRAVVPRFLDNVAADERINYLFALSDLDALRPRLVEFFCSATGGPCHYGGRDMKAAHAQLPIAARHFEAMVEDLMKSLDELGVPAREKDEILAALAPFRGDIVSTR